MKNPILYVIIPCYNEEEILNVTCPIFLDELNSLINKGKISSDSRIMYIDDGSKDSTWEIIKSFSRKYDHIIGISQSKNRGHQSAVLAGLMEAKEKCDIAISIDCDGQDDVSAMDKMVDVYLDGCDVVYGVRSNRETDSFFKRFTAQAFYKLLNIMGAEVIYNHADYRLLSKRVLDELGKYEEVNLYLRGLIPLVGFKSTSVYYERHERMAGHTHYPISKMLGLAFDGITSLSIKPIRIITGLGLFVSLCSFILIIWIIARYFMGATVAGWASMSVIICFMGGIQLISLGVIGEYIGKTYLETKHRPRYIISERTDDAG
ncbi:MAG: glycosyltransferase [Clostridia bacterium]|nr:glycosyltransferase [Clostridia bacterium]